MLSYSFLPADMRSKPVIEMVILKREHFNKKWDASISEQSNPGSYIPVLEAKRAAVEKENHEGQEE